jgi:hypothetical protein
MKTPENPIQTFVHMTTNALHRRSRRSDLIDIPQWMYTSWDVDIDRTECIGIGGFGKIYRAEWMGQVSLLTTSIKHLIICLQVVAVKEINEEIRELDSETMKV